MKRLLYFTLSILVLVVSCKQNNNNDDDDIILPPNNYTQEIEIFRNGEHYASYSKDQDGAILGNELPGGGSFVSYIYDQDKIVKGALFNPSPVDTIYYTYTNDKLNQITNPHLAVNYDLTYNPESQLQLVSINAGACGNGNCVHEFTYDNDNVVYHEYRIPAGKRTDSIVYDDKTNVLAPFWISNSEDPLLLSKNNPTYHKYTSLENSNYLDPSLPPVWVYKEEIKTFSYTYTDDDRPQQKIEINHSTQDTIVWTYSYYFITITD